MCFSPQGDRLLIVSATGIIDVFDFDRCTGTLSNWMAIGSPAPNPIGPNVNYGCSFSPDATKIYVSEIGYYPTGGNPLYQWDLSAANIPASKTLIFTYPDSVNTGQHELGPDGKIYLCQISYFDSVPNNSNDYHLAVINNPNVAGLACNYVYQQVYLEGLQSTFNLPNLPNFNLPPLVAQVAEAGPPQVLICAGDSLHIGYPDSTGGAVTYAWAAHPDVSDTTQPQVWVHPTQSTWYYLTAVDSGFGLPCGKTIDSIHVMIADSSFFPVAFAGNDTTICAGDSIVLGAPAQPGWTYNWVPGGQTSPTIRVAEAGVYRVFVTNPVGVGDCFTVGDLVLVDTFPEPEFAEFAGLDQILCPGDSVRIGSGTGLEFGYAWSAGVSPADTIPAWVAATGSYVLSIFNPDSLGGCFLGTDTVMVLPFDSLLLPPGFAGTDTTICLGDSVLLGTALPSQWVGSWTPRNGSLLFPDSLVSVGFPTVTTAFVVAATDTSNHGACATVRDTVLITVEIPFVHPRPENQEFCPGEVLTVGVSSVSGFSYAWSPITGLNDPFVSSTTVAPLTPIVYTLSVTSDTMISARCKTQYFPVALTTEGCIQQNVVTPNGDGINDFLVLGSFNGPIAVSVYDRWGALVFSSDEYAGNWPLAGADLPETVYWNVVHVAAEGGKAFVGEVMVLR